MLRNEWQAQTAITSGKRRIARKELHRIVARLKRYPERPVRQEQLDAITRDWPQMNAEARLKLHIEQHKHRLTLREIRLVGGRLRRADWADAQTDIGISQVELIVDRSAAHLSARCVACISLFALGRRLQHVPNGDADLLEDLALIADAALSGRPVVTGGGYRITTDPVTGASWRGRGVLLSDIQGGTSAALAINTFLAGDAGGR